MGGRVPSPCMHTCTHAHVQTPSPSCCITCGVLAGPRLPRHGLGLTLQTPPCKHILQKEKKIKGRGLISKTTTKIRAACNVTAPSPPPRGWPLTQPLFLAVQTGVTPGDPLDAAAVTMTPSPRATGVPSKSPQGTGHPQATPSWRAASLHRQRPAGIWGTRQEPPRAAPRLHHPLSIILRGIKATAAKILYLSPRCPANDLGAGTQGWGSEMIKLPLAPRSPQSKRRPVPPRRGARWQRRAGRAALR